MPQEKGPALPLGILPGCMVAAPRSAAGGRSPFASDRAGTPASVKEHRRPTPRQGTPAVADEIRMTEEDTIAPGASQLEDVLELSLLTAGPSAVPVDDPVKDHRLDEP